MSWLPEATTTAHDRASIDQGFSAVVIEELDKAGLTPGAVADATGSTYATACDKVSGIQPWTLDDLCELAELFGTRPGALATLAYDWAVAEGRNN